MKRVSLGAIPSKTTLRMLDLPALHCRYQVRVRSYWALGRLDSRSRSHEQDSGFPPAAVDVFSGEILTSLQSSPLVGAAISILARGVWRCRGRWHAHAVRAIVWLLDEELDDDDEGEFERCARRKRGRVSDQGA